MTTKIKKWTMYYGPEDGQEDGSMTPKIREDGGDTAIGNRGGEEKEEEEQKDDMCEITICYWCVRAAETLIASHYFKCPALSRCGDVRDEM
jgi:hypothetical protein